MSLVMCERSRKAVCIPGYSTSYQEWTGGYGRTEGCSGGGEGFATLQKGANLYHVIQGDRVHNVVF